MSVTDLQGALVHEMKDMLSAERQNSKALRKMSKQAQREELRECFQTHLKETEAQIERLERAFEAVGVAARATRCQGMSGLIEEAEETSAEVGDGVMDAVLIAAAQKLEHYEIAGYGTLCTWAEELGLKDAEQLFRETLEEEKKTDQLLTDLALQINQEAVPE